MEVVEVGDNWKDREKMRKEQEKEKERNVKEKLDHMKIFVELILA